MADEKNPKNDPNNAGDGAGDGGQKNDGDGAQDPHTKGDGDGGSKTVPHQALHQERQLRKEAEEKLKKMEDEKAEEARKAKEKQGEYQTLYEEEKGKNETLAQEKTALQEKVEGFETSFKKSVENQLSGIKNEEDRNMVTQMLEPHSIEKQQELLPSLLEKFGVKQNLNNKPNGGGKPEGVTAQEIENMEKEMREAEAKGDVSTVTALNRKIRKAKQGAN